MKRTIRKFKETVEIRSSFLNRVRSSRYFPLALLVIVFLAAACVHVWQRVRVLDLVYEVSLLKHENRELTDDIRKVYSDIAALSVSSRVETYAADTLGLVMVPPERLYTLEHRHQGPAVADGLDMVLAAVKRMAGHLPVVEETRANAGELRNPKIDSLARQGEQ